MSGTSLARSILESGAVAKWLDRSQSFYDSIVRQLRFIKLAMGKYFGTDGLGGMECLYE